MKKILLFLFVCINFSTFSQTNWIKGNAVWHYEYFNTMQNGALRIETIGDTIIQGHVCKELKCDLHSKLSGANGSFTHLIDTEYKFIYFEQDTVWYLKDNVFFVLYDFTAVQGQFRQLELSDFGTPPECNDSSYLFIDSVYSGFLNGQSAMFYETRDSSLNSRGHGGLVNSRFGMMSSDFAPTHIFFPSYGWCDQESSYEGAMYRLLCFQDDSLIYNPGNVDCEYYTYLGLDQLSMEKTTIYPNPTTGNLNILSDVPVSNIEVFDSYGRRCITQSPNLTLVELDLSGLNSGMYLLKITTNTNEVTIKRIQRN